jgi:hypothetical protein
MGATLAGVAYIWFAQAVAFLLMPRAIPFAMRARALGFWAITVVIVLVFQNPLIALFGAAAMLVIAAPFSPAQRASFFLIAIPAVPVFIVAPLPFPGINYLTDITHYKLTCMIVLLPVLFLAQGGEKRQSTLSGPGAFVLIYATYATLLITLSYGITLGLRFLVDQVLLVIVPYFAVLVALRKTEDVDSFFQAFLIAALMLATVALVSTLVRWDIYAGASSLITEVRDGTLRINATAGTHSLAFHLAAGVMVLEYLRYRLAMGWVWTNVLRVVLVAGMLTADSRGALGGLVIAYGLYTVIMLRSAALRAILLSAAAVGSIGAIIWLTQGEVATYDEFGTFAYRQELLRTSIEYIGKYPFFGDRYFMQSGSFDHLIQGQGIIDITNLYLQVALTFGLVGLFFFLCVFFFPPLAMGRALLRVNRPKGISKVFDETSTEEERWFRASAVTVSICAGWLFLVATTSNVGLTPHIGIVFAAICCALRKVRQAETVTESNTSPDQKPTSAPLKAPFASA